MYLSSVNLTVICAGIEYYVHVLLLDELEFTYEAPLMVLVTVIMTDITPSTAGP